MKVFYITTHINNSDAHNYSMNTDPHASIVRTAFFRFHQELNDFLMPSQKQTSVAYAFSGHPSIKDTIEAIGIPHTEVDLILIDGRSVDFTFQMQGGESIAVYPVFEPLDISDLVHLRDKPLRSTKFIVDVNLGKLAQKLRLLGFDSLYKNDLLDKEIVDISLQQRRIILTRDKGILKNSAVTHGYWVRSDNPQKQITEVVKYFQLKHNFKPFTRCSTCNGLLQKVTKMQLQDSLPADTLQDYELFMACKGCGKLYWQGCHYDRICEWIKNLILQG